MDRRVLAIQRGTFILVLLLMANVIPVRALGRWRGSLAGSATFYGGFLGEELSSLFVRGR